MIILCEFCLLLCGPSFSLFMHCWNKFKKNVKLDFQSRSTHYNLIFTGTEQQNNLKTTQNKKKKLTHDAINNITFHRTHCIGAKNNSYTDLLSPNLNISHTKIFVKSRGRELTGQNYGMNDQWTTNNCPRLVKEATPNSLTAPWGGLNSLSDSRQNVDDQLYQSI